MKSYITRLLDGVVANTTGDSKSLVIGGIRGMYGLCQVSGITTATVKLFGRMTTDHTWKEITSFTSDDAVEVVLFPLMRADVESYSAGTIYVDVLGENQ